jgi:hypothetical protein
MTMKVAITIRRMTMKRRKRMTMNRTTMKGRKRMTMKRRMTKYIYRSGSGSLVSH